MRIVFAALACCLTASVLEWRAFAQGKEFPPGALRAFQDLPAGRFRDQVERLPAGVRARAVAWLGNIHFTEGDMRSLHVDPSGGVYFVDDFQAPRENVQAEENKVDVAAAAVPANPFPANLVFHSKPGAPNVIYLNFTGQTITNTAWNDSIGRSSIPAVAFSTDSDLTTFSDAEQLAIRRIWQRVAEDYAAFDVNVTTASPGTFTTRTAHALITRSTDANGLENPASSSGGVAYVGVFANSTYGKYRPAWIYSDNLAGEESYIAEAVSHEIGHNLGLTHDGKTDGSDYYGGHGSGEISWGPLMGTGYNRNVSQWSKGDYYLGNNTQDDLATIAGKLSYRTDDHGNTLGTASTLTVSSGGNVTSTTPQSDPTNTSTANKGRLDRSTDADVFSFTTGAGAVNLSIAPWIVAGAQTRGGNIDLTAELHNASGQLLLANNAPDRTGAVIQTNLAGGVYYLTIKSTGAGNPTSSDPSGYTSYGSIGQYFISGSVVQNGMVIPPGADLAITDITASGSGAKSFTVTYADDAAIDVATIGSGDVRVTGPNGFDRTAAFVSVDLNSNGSPRRATYNINPPGSIWSESDNGSYAVTMLTNAVGDTQGAFVPAGSLGNFEVAIPRAIYAVSMDTNPGWSMEGLWQYGPPRYLLLFGPISGHTGTNIVGYNLGGNYENKLAPVYATTPPINCSGVSTLTLQFRRWLRVRNGDTANIQISTNGTTWIDLWSNGGAVADSAWQLVQYSLPGSVAGSSSLRIRWGMASGQTSNDTGWNIDDVTLLGNGVIDTIAPTAALNVANITSAGSPVHTFTVSYTDNTAVKTASLGSSDLIIVGVNGTNVVEYGGVDVDSDGTPRTALYSMNAPTGLWQSSDNGEYQIYLQPGEVTDTANNSMEPALLGKFTVAVSTVQQALIVQPQQLTITEGRQASFSVSLAAEPSANVVVVSRISSGDPDIAIVSGGTNVFTKQNWNVPVAVGLTALQDSDQENGFATISCQSDALATVNVTVTEQDTTPTPPTITLTAPGNNAQFSTMEAITFGAEASDDGFITEVEFFANGDLLGSDTNAPFRFTAALPAGAYAISAKATDNAGESATSSEVSIMVTAPNNPPSIAIVTPVDGTNLESSAPIEISVSASDDGAVSKVEFFANDTFLGGSSASPYSFSATLAPGRYTIGAIATDDTGLITTANPVEIEVIESEINPPEILAISTVSGTVNLTASTSSSSAHILEGSTDFQVWTPISTNAPVSGSVDFSHSPSDSQIFYRVVIERPSRRE